MHIYNGDDIVIEEMPQGCILSRADGVVGEIVVATIQDARALIESLQHLVEALESKHGN